LSRSKQREHALRSFNRLLLREMKFFEANLKDQDHVKILRHIAGSGEPFFRKIGEKSWSAKTMEAMAGIKGFHQFATNVHRLAVRSISRNTVKYCRQFMSWIQNYDCPKLLAVCFNRPCNCPELSQLLLNLNSTTQQAVSKHNQRRGVRRSIVTSDEDNRRDENDGGMHSKKFKIEPSSEEICRIQLPIPKRYDDQPHSQVISSSSNVCPVKFQQRHILPQIRQELLLDTSKSHACSLLRCDQRRNEWMTASFCEQGRNKDGSFGNWW